MKKILLIFMFIIFNLISAQTFTELNTEIPDVVFGDAQWGDYDNDGDLDIAVTGQVDSLGLMTKIYNNDGTGNFTVIDSMLVDVHQSSVDWGDYDNDGDLDLLITGNTGDFSDLENVYISKIYRNDEGSFIDINAGLVGLCNAIAHWGDYDNDGNLDILISGTTFEHNMPTYIYQNTNGIFIHKPYLLSDFSILDSKSSWIDFDSDGDLDIIATGYDYDQSMVLTQVYRNDDSFFSDIGLNLPGVEQGTIVCGDYDNDGDTDVLIFGNEDTYLFRN
ncbi:MAG: VCBS repeat-containing protein, partial [Candidatus Delongbacteria bacterium]|nr:VCBS repeat-containing protein [Candidatus Delongbacteria bacterium]